LVDQEAVKMRSRTDAGETLVEIVFSVVLISLAVTGLVSALATASQAGAAQRASVTVDVVTRNYAEATKAAVQGCTFPGSYTVAYTPPTGYHVSSSGSGVCPDPSTAPAITLTVTAPNGTASTMQIRIRTP
jgi:Tfp pilus assembly protein PilV